jgi:queuine tRNA-ribosyltransferase
MDWDRPILTDSGGYQVFSLESLRKVDDDGVSFRSHLDGRLLHLTPERATAIQQNLGADIAMCFDECPPATAETEVIRRAVERTTRWAERCKLAHQRPDQVLFGIVQGGIDPAQRLHSARQLADLDFPGYAVGGLSVGESAAERNAVLDVVDPALPREKPRYLMGVGRPEDLLDAIARGIDMFDCVMPTRNGRNAMAFTSQGPLRLRNLKYQDDAGPLDPACGCYACRRFSRAYLRHLFMVDEMLGPTLLSLHNLAFYNDLMLAARAAIEASRYAAFHAETAVRVAPKAIDAPSDP